MTLKDTAKLSGAGLKPQSDTKYATITISCNAVLFTEQGAKRAEDILPNDRIISRDMGLVRVMDVSSTSQKLALCQVPKDALGPNAPNSNTDLDPDQMIIMRDYSAVPLLNSPVKTRKLSDIHHMIGAKMQSEKAHQTVTLQLETPCFIYVNQLEAVVS